MVANWDPDCDSILDLAEQHGLNPDYSCRAGICHTCACGAVSSGNRTEKPCSHHKDASSWFRAPTAASASRSHAACTARATV
ncbi:MAG: 2Fe-2S iron-sulfur cluster binding domain-containing protein [Proteobacteria bacterium]|nr:2Fe-2S iron-sulfur cluster binding domain-containing protein [Pseudomonadota bacterium]